MAAKNDDFRKEISRLLKQAQANQQRLEKLRSDIEQLKRRVREPGAARRKSATSTGRQS
jgi:hypothetical protein